MLNHKQDSLFFGDMRQFSPSTCTFAAFLSSCQQSGKDVVTSDLSSQDDRTCHHIHAYLAQASLDLGQPLHALQQDIDVPEPIRHAELSHTNLWMNFRYNGHTMVSLRCRTDVQQLKSCLVQPGEHMTGVETSALHLAQQVLRIIAWSSVQICSCLHHAVKLLTLNGFSACCRPSRCSLHYDPYHNLLCMVQGQKTVKLMSPEATAFLYPHSLLGESPNHSQVNFADPDLQQHPLYPQALQSQQEFHLKVSTMNLCNVQ